MDFIQNKRERKKRGDLIQVKGNHGNSYSLVVYIRTNFQIIEIYTVKIYLSY